MGTVAFSWVAHPKSGLDSGLRDRPRPTPNGRRTPARQLRVSQVFVIMPSWGKDITVYIHIYRSIHMLICIYIYIYMHICIYIYIYAYTFM